MKLLVQAVAKVQLPFEIPRNDHRVSNYKMQQAACLQPIASFIPKMLLYTYICMYLFSSFFFTEMYLFSFVDVVINIENNVFSV
jgi:hypothetical protein